VADEDAVVIDIRTKRRRKAKRDLTDVAREMGWVRDAQGPRSGRREYGLFGSAIGATSKGINNLRQSMQLGATASYALRRGVYATGVVVAGVGVLGDEDGPGLQR
jgi:hypothetical protein